MSLLTPQQIAVLADKGLTPEADHTPSVLIEAYCDDRPIMAFMLTHVDPNHPEQAYGLIDFGHGKPRRSMVFIPQLETHDNPESFDVRVAPDFAGEYPISVYEKAAQMRGRITTAKASLEWAATHLELTKARDRFSSALKDHHDPDGPAFLPFNFN